MSIFRNKYQLAFSMVAIFYGAFLLFALEPMVARFMLPLYGGSAAVWNVALLFFQILLLVGYYYAHLTSRFSPKTQALIHLVVLAVPLVLAILGFGILSVPKAGTDQNFPTFHLLINLLQICGLPFFALSAGAPLLQRLYSLLPTDEGKVRDPYFLYAASNAGSLIGLLAYPFLLEPLLGLRLQATVWRTEYVIYFFVLILAFGTWLTTTEPKGQPQAKELIISDSKPISGKQTFLWLALSALPSSLLLGVTTYLTTNIAPIPLLWVLPLALYLITFIVAFSKKAPDPLKLARLIPLICTPLALALILESTEPLIPLALFHLAAFFLVTLSCHTRLANSRPEPARLTQFYLTLSAGGAIGGIFNALIAPAIFKTLAEYPIALALGCALAAPKLVERAKKGNFVAPPYWPVLVFGVTIVATYLAVHSSIAPSPGRTLITIGVPAIMCFVASDVPITFGISLLALFAGTALSQTASDGSIILSARSFYGVHRVIEDKTNHLLKLVHGNTTHGVESLDKNKRDIPLTYYTQSGPAGQLFLDLTNSGRKSPVALIGMGVGSLASYGQSGQDMTFFEIDPDVIQIASRSNLFHFIGDSKAKVNIVEGDGRLMIALQPPNYFGLIVLDAFTSDSIPVHLLTEDAIRIYLSKLQTGGIIAFHISNRYLNLAPILAREAQDLNLTARFESDDMISDQELAAGKTASQWFVVSQKLSDLPKNIRFWDNPTKEWQSLPRPWTDDYSNVLGAFHPNH